MPTILVIEDEQDLRELLALKLQREGYSTLEAGDGLSGEKIALKEQPDLIVLDLMLPEKNGFAVCKSLRKDSRTRHIPVLMLTAKAGQEDRIAGLELGADDFMAKPFSPKELVLRVRSILRRTKSVGGSTIEIGEFRIDKEQRKFHLAGEEIDLTSTEFKLLLSLIETPGATRERGELLELVWGYSDQIQTRTLDTHIKRLRTKLGDHGASIETIRAIGYRFAESTESKPPEG